MFVFSGRRYTWIIVCLFFLSNPAIECVCVQWEEVHLDYCLFFLSNPAILCVCVQWEEVHLDYCLFVFLK